MCLAIPGKVIANEGKLLAICAPEDAEQLLVAMRRHPLGKDAAVIGRVMAENSGLVAIRTTFGATRIVDMLANDPLPRIC